MSKILVNAVGDACPIPVTKTIHALSGMTEAGTVEVHVDNETAVQNLNRLATGKGLKFSAEKREEKLFVVTLTVDDPAAVSGTAPEEAACTPDNRDNTVVVIGTSCLGSGDDTLGATLMKGFLYALGQQERLPRTILFYNGGAKITTEAETLAAKMALVHGDVSPKNILVGPKGPVFLDAECAWWGGRNE